MTESWSQPETGSSRSSRSREVFVGRQRETETLVAAFDDASAGHGRLVVLVGEPGIGKTRTARELASYTETQGAKVLWGWCYEDDGAPPYWPWLQPIRAYVQQASPDRLRSEMGSGAVDIAVIVSELKNKMPELEAPPAAAPEQARFRLFDSVTNFLKNASQSQPLVLVLDDLHWADKPSLLLLQFLAQELAVPDFGRLLVVGCYRDVELSRQHPLSETLVHISRTAGGGGAGGFQRVVLRGFDHEGTAHFIEGSAGIEPADELVEALYSHTEGNPFFMTEVIRLLSESGELTAERNGPPETLRIPEGVREAIGQRLNRLSDQCNEVLTTASAISREFTLNQLNRLFGSLEEDRLLEVLEDALASQVIEELPNSVGRYQFTHALIRETLLDEISTTRRVRLLARIAETLEALYENDIEAHAGELAYFFDGAEPVLGHEKLVRYSNLAGQQALAVYAWEEAEVHFERALAAKQVSPSGSDPATDAENAELLFGLGRAQVAVFPLYRVGEAVATLNRAFTYYADAGDAGRALARIHR